MACTGDMLVVKQLGNDWRAFNSVWLEVYTSFVIL